MLRSVSRALLALILVLLPAAARAALTLTSLDLDVEIQGTNGTDSAFEVTFTVTGTEIATATVTPQGTGGAPINLTPCTAGISCTTTLSNLNQTQFNALFPTSGRDYKIDLTQIPPSTGDPETITDTLPFTLPAAPSPAISFPTSSAPIEPADLQVTFSACASCSEATRAVLSHGASELASQDLPGSSTSWTPQAQLAPNTSGYSVRITHRTSGSLTTPSPRYDPGDVAYSFDFAVTHSDAVTFSTSFAPPRGAFCVVVNQDPVDASGCDSIVSVTQPAAGILDTSDSDPLTEVREYTTTAAGIPIEYTLQLAPNGKLSGIAEARIGGDTAAAIPTQLVGRLKGKDGLLRQKIRMRFDEPASDTKFRVRIQEEANLAALLDPLTPLEWLIAQKTRGKAGGVKLKETTTDTLERPAPTGWKLEFMLTGTEGPISGRLELTNGVGVALGGRHRFDSTANRSDVELRSEGAERGVLIRVKKLEIDATKTPAEITAGSLRFRAFGQRGSALLP